MNGVSFINNNIGTAVGWDGTILKTTNGGITFIEDNEIAIVANFILMQNYPNPFNPITTIKYEIPKSGFVSLMVYDVLGNEIATLINEEKPAGDYEVNFSATSLSTGIYFYRLQTGSYSMIKKMTLIK